MKQISKTIRKEFKMPLIFRNDLEVIEQLLKTDTADQSFKIKTPNFEYDSVSEINSKLKNENQLSISAREPYISIDLNKHSAYLYASDSETKTIGIVSKIEEVIKKRERKLRWLSTRLSMFLAGPLFVIVFGIFTKLKEKGVADSRWMGLYFYF